MSRSEDGSEPAASVVIPNWNGAEVLPGCLRALQEQRPHGFETIVVDNGSTDGSLELVERLSPGATIVALGANRGFAAAANEGARRARAPYVAFLNNDAEPASGWLEELRACLERHPRAASATPKVLLRGAERLLDGAGDAMTWSLKAYRRGQGEPDDGRYATEEQVFAASGTAPLWRRDVFLALGGFDETFFAYYEDVDLGFRARLRGHEAWYAPQAVVYHRGGATSRARRREFESFHAVRNRWLTIAKNVPGRWLLRHAPAIAAGEALSFGRSLLNGGGLRHVAAYASFVRSLPPALAARRGSRPAERELRALRSCIERRFPPASSSLSRRRQTGLGGGRS